MELILVDKKLACFLSCLILRIATHPRNHITRKYVCLVQEVPEVVG